MLQSRKGNTFAVYPRVSVCVPNAPRTPPQKTRPKNDAASPASVGSGPGAASPPSAVPGTGAGAPMRVTVAYPPMYPV